MMFRTLIRTLCLIFALAPPVALAQSAPANLPAQTVYGRLGIPGDTGPGQAIPFATLGKQLSQTSATLPYVILATGQSNFTHAPAFNWTPASNVSLWNFTGVDGNVGTAFATISNSTINGSWKTASDIAAVNPARRVCLINISFPGIPITNWLPATSAPDVYQNIQNNITTALAACGATKIDLFDWWQIETSTADTGYQNEFTTLMTRFWTNAWFQQETPILIHGMASTAQSGDGNADAANYRLVLTANADPERRKFLYTNDLSDSIYWADALHLSGQGYFSAGAMAARTILNGSSRNTLALPGPSGNLLPNAALLNPATTVNGTACTLGLTCAPPVIVGTTLIGSGSAGGILYNNAGALGNLATGNSAVLITTAGGVPTLSTTLPTGLALQTPVSIALTNATGLPVSTGLVGTGTGVPAALGNATNGANGLVTFNGNIGTATGHASLDLAAANNLSDVASAATARSNLGIANYFSVANAVLNAAPANPTGTTSTAAPKMMGLGATCHITPVNSTRVEFVISGFVSNNTAADGVGYQLSYGTSTAPSNAAAAAGTTFGSAPVQAFTLSGGTSFAIPFHASGIATGLTTGTAYWFDMQLEAITGGTASVQSLTCTAHEV